MTTAISIKGLSKKFTIAGPRQTGSTYRSLRDVMSETTRQLGQRLLRKAPAPLAKSGKQDFWALRDIDLEIEQGDKLAIIGHNGAGKSTLLKILTQITEPTTGRIALRGRVASLLEVGTGFHPELTGRENIFLNGAILGMTSAEIRRKFDEIVDFAGVETFLDTPVKRYSSGMRLRLGFAVAAHLESEILIIDEVLAVGDAAFQKKCIGKMDDIARGQGRTILFVSHNMGAVQQLCNKGAVLSHGKLLHTGGISDSISAYFESIREDAALVEWRAPADQGGSYFNRYLDLLSLRIVDGNDQLIMAPCPNNAPPSLVFEVDVKVDGAEVGYILYNRYGVSLFATSTLDAGDDKNPLQRLGKGRHTLVTQVPARLLNEGSYTVAPFAFIRNDECFFHPARDKSLPHLTFEISGGLSDTDFMIKAREGEFAPILEWKSFKEPATP